MAPGSLLKRLRAAYAKSAIAVATNVAKELARSEVRGEVAWGEAERIIERYRNGNDGAHGWIFAGLAALALSEVVDDALDPGPGDEPRPSDLPGQAFFVARHDVFRNLIDLHDMEVD